MDVAVKTMMFQQRQRLSASGYSKEERASLLRECQEDQENKKRQMVLREAAMCCSMSHPNVVATYHYEVLQASAFCQAPSGLRITDKSNEGDFKLFLIQARTMSHGGGTYYESWWKHTL